VRSRPAADRDPDYLPRVVDRFRVRRADGQPVPDWDAFAVELTALARLLRADLFEEVHRRLIPGSSPRWAAECRSRRAADFDPLDLTIDAAGADFATVVRIGAADRFGFLSRTAGALGPVRHTESVQADVRTRGDRVADTFW